MPSEIDEFANCVAESVWIRRLAAATGEYRPNYFFSRPTVWRKPFVSGAGGLFQEKESRAGYNWRMEVCLKRNADFSLSKEVYIA